MRTNPDRENLFQEAMARIGSVSPSEGADVLMHYFMSVLDGLDAGGMQRLRDELSTHFGGRYCGGHTCQMMVDLVNGHLAGRKTHPQN